MVWENFWRDYSWKFPQYGKGNNQVQEAHRVPYRINPGRNTPRHILIKLKKTKHKGGVLKAAREKQQETYKGNPICLTADLSAEILQARREWQDIFKVLKGKKSTANLLLYLARLSFKINGEIKNFMDKQKLKRIQHHQTSFTTNIKRIYIVKKYKRRKKIYKINQTINKMVIGTYISTITLNVNG